MAAKVDLGRNQDVGFKLAVTLEVTLPHLPRHEAQILVDKAHQVCPSLNAVRGNIDVDLIVVGH